MWAIARYDFGLTQEEFGRLTPGMFKALLSRKQARFREQLYLAGITASMVWNMTPKKSDKALSPWDFVPDPEAETRRDELKRNVSAFFGMIVESGANKVFDVEGVRKKIVDKLKGKGHDDVEEVVDEVFVAWKLRREKEARDGGNSRNTDS